MEFHLVFDVPDVSNHSTVDCAFKSPVPVFGVVDGVHQPDFIYFLNIFTYNQESDFGDQ